MTKVLGTELLQKRIVREVVEIANDRTLSKNKTRDEKNVSSLEADTPQSYTTSKADRLTRV